MSNTIKTHWQTQLDQAKDYIAANPLFVDIDDPDREPVDCQTSVSLKGWDLKIGMYKSKVGQHWLIVTDVDPPERKLTQEDHSLLHAIAFYLGATKKNLRFMIKDNRPKMLTWDVFED